MKLLLKLSFSLILIGVIIWQLGGLGEIGKVMAGIDPLFVFPILIVSTLDRALMTFKWARLLGARGMHLPFLQGMKIYCASMVWGLFLPSTVGADAIRAFSTSRAGLNSNEVVSSIIIERMVGFFAALVFGVLGIFFLSQAAQLDARFTPVLWGIGALTGVAAAIFALSFSRSLFDVIYDRVIAGFSRNRVVRRFRELHETYLSYRADKRSLGIFFGLTLSEQLFSIVVAWLIAIALGVDASFLLMAGVIPLTMLLARLPLSFDGIGIFEGIFALLLSLAGISAAEAVSIALTARLLNVLAWLPWWMAHVAETNQIRVPKDARV